MKREREKRERGKRERECVRGSYSARVPRSSLARVHREFVHHIVEDEVGYQEGRQDDKREDGQQREHMRMTHGM